MCSRYLLASKIETIEKRFNVSCKLKEKYKPCYNVSEGKKAWVISCDNPSELVPFVFGFTPFDSKNQALIVNARAEGNKNRLDDPNYTGGMGIVFDPLFRQNIRGKRCLVIADGFYEGSSSQGLDDPYLVYLRGKNRPFAFAGVWEAWTHPKTMEKIHGFAIVTTPANSLLYRVGCKRSPVILHPGQESTWLNSSAFLGKVVSMLNPYPPEYMDAYQVSTQVKYSENDYPDLVKQTGKRFGEPQEKLERQIIQMEALMRKEQVNLKRPQSDRDKQLIAQHTKLVSLKDTDDPLPL